MRLFFGFGEDFLTLVAAAFVAVPPGPDVTDWFFDTARFDTAFLGWDVLAVLAVAFLFAALPAAPFDAVLFLDVFFVTLRFLTAALVEDAAFFAATFLAPCAFLLGATVYSRCLCRRSCLVPPGECIPAIPVHRPGSGYDDGRWGQHQHHRPAGAKVGVL
jgi:hypothetical protein